jgi:hypothetical protein
MASLIGPDPTVGRVVSCPSFHPDGRSDFVIVLVQDGIVSLSPVAPDGHYVSRGIGCRTVSDLRRVGWYV